jgi:ABC-2 type transport system ATP-binding protein
MDSTHDAVAVDGLTKRFGDRVAVDHLTFTVPRGAVAGLIGPNGAGKTTLMAMLLGLVRASDGSATVLDHPIERTADYLGRVGALIETPAFHPAVSGVDNLRALALLARQSPDDIDDLITLVGLDGRGDDRYGSYSLGMKQRLGIAAALLGDPELVILDEPTNGLDPVGMQDVRALIGEIAGHGRTVLVSSHLLSELEQVCDWLVVIDRGGLVHLGPPDTLAGTDRLVLRASDAARADDLAALAGSSGLRTTTVEGTVLVTLDGRVDTARLAAEINRRAHAADIVLTELHHQRADLESRYLDLVHASPNGDDR